MKYVISTFLLAIALFVGVTTIGVAKFGDNIIQQEIPFEPTNHSNQSSNERHFFLSSADIQPYAFANEQIRLSFSSQNASVRTFSISNASRIIYSSQLAKSKFHSADASFLLQFAHKQLIGYYLYHLRKLLI